MKINSKRGFTLIELIVVITIIAILAALIILRIGGASRDARNSRRQADMAQIKTAIEQWKGKCGTPAVSKGTAADPLPANSTIEAAAAGANIVFVTSGVAPCTANVATYLQGGAWPTDPLGAPYGIYTDASGNYTITRGDGANGANSSNDNPTVAEVPDIRY